MSKQPSLKDLVEQVERIEKQQAETLTDIAEKLADIREDIGEAFDSIKERLDRLEQFTGVNEVESFSIQQTGDDMAVTGIAPGATGNFTATPLDSSGNPISLPAGAQPPVWSTSDPTNAPVVASADGLSASVTVPSTTAGGVFTLSVSSPDLPGSPSGAVSVPINVAPPPPPATVASFSINQNS